MEENRCIISGMVIPEGRMVCPLCEAKYGCQTEQFEKALKELRHIVAVEKAIATIYEAFNELIRQWENIFCDCREQLQEFIYTIKEKIPKTPYFFKKKTLIRDKRPHKQHRIRNNCRKERQIMQKQLDIFGNEIKLNEIDRREKQKRKRYRTMQQMHGIKEGKKCGECKHCIGFKQSKVWYKCKLWIMSHSTATDIRLKDTACNKFESEESDNG